MSFYVQNPTNKIITLYSTDGLDSVDVYPNTSVPLDDKFKARLPKAVIDKSVINDYSHIFLPITPNPAPPVVTNPSVVTNIALYQTLGFI